jgi:hypothetical protein
MRIDAPDMPMIATAESPAPLSLSAYGKARSTVQGAPLNADELRKIHAYWLQAAARYRTPLTDCRIAILSHCLPWTSPSSSIFMAIPG